MLGNFKKVDSKPINEKAMKKLEEVGKKNGLDPSFMTETFGVEKNHNPELLGSIIDKHNHVKREAVKELFKSGNDQEVLQAIFSKNSTVNPERLRELMNDPDSADIIRGLADAETGVVAPEVAAALLDKNSKFSKEFVKELLKGDNGMAETKVRELLKDNPDKEAREAALKAMKKVGGSELQNKALLENMLGEGSKLSTEAFVRVANDLPKDLIEKFFGEKSAANDLIIEKLLNNKKLDLKKISSIL